MKHESKDLSADQELRAFAAAEKFVRAVRQIGGEVAPQASALERLQLVATLCTQGVMRETGVAFSADISDDAPGVAECLLMGVATAAGTMLGRIPPGNRPNATRLFLASLQAGAEITAPVHNEPKGTA